MGSRPKQTVRVGISGSYGGLNLGDEAILAGIVTQLRRSLPAVEITVFSRDAEDTKRRHGVDRVLPVRKLSRDEVLPEVQRLDLFILGGGGILFDGEAHIFLREVMMAHEAGVPVMVYAISAGPLRDPAAQKVVREGLNRAAVVTVRERDARHLLEEIGVHREITVTADPALLLEPEPLPDDALKREGLDGGHTLIGVSVREPGAAAPDISEHAYHALLADAADFMVDRFDAIVVFVPMEPTMLDVQHSHAVVSKMLRPQRATVLKGTYTSGQMLSLVEHFAFAVGMRLHFLIFASLQNVPFVALPYASKVGGFLDDMGLAMPPLNLVNAGRLIAHIDHSWDRRRSLQARIGRALPALRRRALLTNEAAVRLLTREVPAAAAGADNDVRPGVVA
ncbi:MAG TPA: polysaccharide pyruvyl transferase family protein [Geminicoccaceae bacterium]|nr:polysaccharide pyruvyl transferase family protein [Geminicoccaceae bacterium]